MKETSSRALVEHLLRKHELILVRAVSSADGRLATLKNLEEAEKRFLLAFLAGIAGGSYWLATELWGLNVGNLLTLPIYQVAAIILALAVILTSAAAVLSYLSIGLVVQRAVEIKPRESD
jgi:hypothetical protein